MARIKHSAGIEEMPEAHSKDGIVERRKIFRDYDGNVTKVGRLEAYVSTTPQFQDQPSPHPRAGEYVAVRRSLPVCEGVH